MWPAAMLRIFSGVGACVAIATRVRPSATPAERVAATPLPRPRLVASLPPRQCGCRRLTNAPWRRPRHSRLQLPCGAAQPSQLPSCRNFPSALLRRVRLPCCHILPPPCASTQPCRWAHNASVAGWLMPRTLTAASLLRTLPCATRVVDRSRRRSRVRAAASPGPRHPLSPSRHAAPPMRPWDPYPRRLPD